MRTVGIICECNPMHEGHRYLIAQAKSAGADAVVCIMSGCFTQRAEPALLDPRTRARILLTGGADAVLELPFPYAAAGAEFFAAAGVSVLERLGVSELWFGSECGDIDLLSRAADASLSKEFSERYREACRAGASGTAQAYFEGLQAALGADVTFRSNDALGISYLRALKQRRSSMHAVTVARVGSGFHERVLQNDRFPSASALRAAFLQNGVEAWQGYLSAEALQPVKEQVEQGLAPALWGRAETAVLAQLRLTDPMLLESVPELGGGLGRRIAELARSSTDFDGLIKRSVTKKYTEARIRRGILYAMTGVQAEDLRTEPAYAVLLAANDAGCAFLSKRRKQAHIPTVTSHAAIPHTDAAKRQAFLTQQAFSLYTLCLPRACPADAFLHCSSFIARSKDWK